MATSFNTMAAWGWERRCGASTFPRRRIDASSSRSPCSRLAEAWSEGACGPSLCRRGDERGNQYCENRVALNVDAWIGPDALLHLGSAFDGDWKKDLDNPQSC